MVYTIMLLYVPFQDLFYLIFPLVASAPTRMMAVQEGLTSIRVTWNISGDASGYRIDYNSSTDDTHKSVRISDGCNNTVLLSNLVVKANYTISIVATSLHFHSTAVDTQVTLSE